jgi:Flp pilus assembly protein TadG
VKLGRLVRATRGAALVEFVIAIVPMLMLFFTIAQFSALGYTSLLVRHAAFVAARAYAIVNPGNPDSGPATDVQTAAQMVMGRVPGMVSVQSSGAAPMSQAMQTTTVTLLYSCTVPLGNMLVCGPGLTRPITAGAAFPNQGTYMQKVWGFSQ